MPANSSLLVSGVAGNQDEIDGYSRLGKRKKGSDLACWQNRAGVD